MIEAMKIVDPKSYTERLSRIPKFVVVSSDDEFMSMVPGNPSILLDHFSLAPPLYTAPHAPHAYMDESCCPLLAHAYWMLMGACNPISVMTTSCL